MFYNLFQSEHSSQDSAQTLRRTDYHNSHNTTPLNEIKPYRLFHYMAQQKQMPQNKNPADTDVSAGKLTAPNQEWLLPAHTGGYSFDDGLVQFSPL
jgi:hypothetical protein